MFFNLLVRGTQVVVHSYQMLKRVLKTLLFSSLFIVLIITTIRIGLELNNNDITLLYKYSLAKFYININKPNKLISVSLNNNKNKPLTSNSSLSTFNYQLSTINSQLSNPNNSKLSTINSQLSTINSQLSTINYVVSAKQIVKDKYIITFINNRFKNIVLYNLIYCIRLYIYILTFILIIFLIKGYTSIKSNFIRGNKIVSPNVLNKIIRNRNGLYYTLFHKKQYKIANILTYPKGTESLHTIITGTTGTGKTVLLTNLIKQIRNKGDRAIIYDKMGTFTSRFYNPNKDVILNPLDDRSPYWSIFNEAKNTIDFETIAAALIPDTGSDPFFTQAARILFSSVASELFKRGCTSNKELTDKLLKTELKDSAELVKGTAAQAIIDENNPKTALSVMAVLSANLKSLLHLRETPPNEVLNKKHLENDSLNESKVSSNENKIFSIRNWIQNDNQDGFLFLTSRADQHETLKPLISTWMDISINTLLSLEQSKDRNVWIIIDELPSLNYLPSLHSGLAESRQFGGRFVLALQLPAQLKSIYGDRKAEATSGLCGTRIILRTPDEDTATWCSNNLGKIETEEVKQSMSFASSESKDTVSLNKSIITKSIVSATEIMNLDNLNAYVKFAGDFPITKLTFKYKNYPKIAEKFIERKTNKIVDSGKLIVDSYEKLKIENYNELKVENEELKIENYKELKTDSLSDEYINNYNDNNNNNNSNYNNNNYNNYNSNNNQNSNYHHNKNKNENETATSQQQEPTIIKVKNINNKNILSPELRAIRDNMIQEGKIIVEKSTVEENNNDNKPSIINSHLLNCNNDITNDDKLSDDNIGDL